MKSKTKSKLAVLSFVGQLSKTLFGTATIDDVEILARHVNALTSKAMTLTKVMTKHAQHESSYMASVDKRISNFVLQISDNHTEINLLQKSLSNNVIETEKKYFVY